LSFLAGTLKTKGERRKEKGERRKVYTVDYLF